MYLEMMIPIEFSDVFPVNSLFTNEDKRVMNDFIDYVGYLILLEMVGYE